MLASDAKARGFDSHPGHQFCLKWLLKAVFKYIKGERMNRKEQEKAIIAHYQRLGFKNCEELVKNKTNSEIENMYYEILD